MLCSRLQSGHTYIMKKQFHLPFLEMGEAFPPVDQAWPNDSGAPGLLAAGGCLDVATLRQAYRQGIFPWFSENQPILWWSTHPRMVLRTDEFKLSLSLKKEIRRLLAQNRLSLKIDHSFEQVIHHCANTPRKGQAGTWIQPEMIEAYTQLHKAGLAHSVETWIDGELVAGLYCVSIGQMVFGESMFTHVTNGSKIALTGLIAFCRKHQFPLIDCQQETSHLASLGATPIPRGDFVQQLAALVDAPSPAWNLVEQRWFAEVF